MDIVKTKVIERKLHTKKFWNSKCFYSANKQISAEKRERQKPKNQNRQKKKNAIKKAIELEIPHRTIIECGEINRH